MSQRNNSVSRAHLLGGMIAAGALAACARTKNVAAVPVAPSSAVCTTLSPSLAPDRFGVNQIFSHPAFAGLNTSALLTDADRSPDIDALHQAYLVRAGQQVQTTNSITQIPSAGIVIQTPGTYTFANNIVWSPGNGATAAITIASSNVTLNLAGFSLTANISDKSQRFTGILVPGPGTVANIAVVNGTIANFTEYGVLARYVCGLNIAQVIATGICLQNTSIRRLTPAGIHVSWSDNVAVASCQVTNLGVMTDSSAGIMLMGVVQAAVSDCVVNGMLNIDGAVQGFSLIGCMNVATTSCTASSLQSQDTHHNYLTSGHTVLGFCPIFCLSLSYVDCTASGLTGCCDDCHGMSVFLDSLVSVTRFRANNVLDGASPYNTGAKATGLEVYGSLVTVTDSVVNGISAINPQDLQAAGFSAWGALNQFVRCTASNVSVQDASGRSRGVGFGWAPDPRWLFSPIGAYFTTYTDCSADHCDAAFDTWNHVNSTWIRQSYTNCTVGMLVEPGATRIVSCNGCSECNGMPLAPGLPPFLPGPVTLTNFASANTY